MFVLILRALPSSPLRPPPPPRPSSSTRSMSLPPSPHGPVSYVSFAVPRTIAATTAATSTTATSALTPPSSSQPQQCPPSSCACSSPRAIMPTTLATQPETPLTEPSPPMHDAHPARVPESVPAPPASAPTALLGNTVAAPSPASLPMSPPSSAVASALCTPVPAAGPSVASPSGTATSAAAGSSPTASATMSAPTAPSPAPSAASPLRPRPSPSPLPLSPPPRLADAAASRRSGHAGVARGDADAPGRGGTDTAMRASHWQRIQRQQRSCGGTDAEDDLNDERLAAPESVVGPHRGSDQLEAADGDITEEGVLATTGQPASAADSSRPLRFTGVRQPPTEPMRTSAVHVGSFIEAGAHAQTAGATGETGPRTGGDEQRPSGARDGGEAIVLRAFDSPMGVTKTSPGRSCCPGVNAIPAVVISTAGLPAKNAVVSTATISPRSPEGASSTRTAPPPLQDGLRPASSHSLAEPSSPAVSPVLTPPSTPPSLPSAEQLAAELADERAQTVCTPPTFARQH